MFGAIYLNPKTKNGPTIMIRLKLVSWLALVMSLCAPLTSFAQKTPHIVVVTHGQVSDSFWLVVKNGVDQAKKDTGANVDYRAPEKFDMVAMGQLIDAAIASKADGIVMSIPDADALAKPIQAAVKAGIPVIAINSGLDASKKLGVLMFVGQEQLVVSKKVGEQFKKMGVKKIACLNQEVGNVALDERAKGLAEGFGGPVEVVAVPQDFTASRNAVAAYVQKNPDVDGYMALGPVAAEPALQALQQSGKIGKVKFATFDLTPSVLEAIDKKQIEFAVDQQQYLQGYLPVVLLSNYIKFGVLPANDTIRTGETFITAADAKQVLELVKKGIR
jgi:simple sugar transport system substrate-binding protein